MSAIEALRLAREHGIRVGVSGADLVLDADREPARAVLKTLIQHKAEIVALLAADYEPWTAEHWQAFFDERADIAEFDGNQSQQQAETIAFECCVVEWLNRHPELSDPGSCAWCKKPDLEGHAVVPFGTDGQGHVWLHPECWTEWREDRRGRAQQALAAFGLKKRASVESIFQVAWPRNKRGPQA